MNVKLLTEHHLRFLSLKETAQARLSLRLTKCPALEITSHVKLMYLFTHMRVIILYTILYYFIGVVLRVFSCFVILPRKGRDD